MLHFVNTTATSFGGFGGVHLRGENHDIRPLPDSLPHYSCRSESTFQGNDPCGHRQNFSMTTQVSTQSQADLTKSLRMNANDPLGLGSIVRDYGSCDLPKTNWITRLQLTQPRENLTCLPTSTRVVKRLGDIIFAVSMILLLGPMLLLVALTIRLTSPGAAIYSQTRVGLNRRSKKKNDRRQSSATMPNGAEDRRGTGIDRREVGNYGRRSRSGCHQHCS